MECPIALVHFPTARLPAGYRWAAWSESLLARHATVKYASFQAEMDSRVFPSLGQAAGCQGLMEQISRHKSFLADATWLITHDAGAEDSIADCATIQGICRRRRIGSIQNVGVAPRHRGLGLGRALVLRALHGFQSAKMKRVFLEVTAENIPAVRLYESLGFRISRTLYHAVEDEPDFCFE